MKIKIIIADEHDLFREGLVKLFSQSKSIEIIEQATDGEELLRKAKIHDPDIILMDIGSSKVNELKTIELLKYFKPGIRIIGLSVNAGSDRINDVLMAGASGYLMKSCDFPQLKEGIVKVFNGHYYLCDQTVDILLRNYSNVAE